MHKINNNNNNNPLSSNSSKRECTCFSKVREVKFTSIFIMHVLVTDICAFSSTTPSRSKRKKIKKRKTCPRSIYPRILRGKIYKKKIFLLSSQVSIEGKDYSSLIKYYYPPRFVVELANALERVIHPYVYYRILRLL